MLTPWPPSHIPPDKNDKIITQWPIQREGPGEPALPPSFLDQTGVWILKFGGDPLPHPPYEGLDGLDDQAPKVWFRHCYMTEIWNFQNEMW